MQRRTFLQKASATTAVASLTFAAGCSSAMPGGDEESPTTASENGSTTTPVSYPDEWTADVESLETNESSSGSTPLQMESFDIKSNDSGALLVTGTVKNSADKKVSHAVIVHVDVQEASHKAGKVFELDAGATDSFELPFPVTLEEFNAKGSLRFSFK